MKKTFKIGEYASYGTWQVILDPNEPSVTFVGRMYSTNEEVERKKFVNPKFWELSEFLNEVMSSYYADKLMKYVETGLPLSQPSYTAFSLP